MAEYTSTAEPFSLFPTLHNLLSVYDEGYDNLKRRTVPVVLDGEIPPFSSARGFR